MNTEILPVNLSAVGITSATTAKPSWINNWTLEGSNTSTDAQSLRRAAQELRTSDVPVAFPTETVYGLGADATRSNAVLGIYKAKQRPSDNPLISHIWSLNQLRDLLEPGKAQSHDGHGRDLIPEIYKPLIAKFWPGPLTLIMPNPSNSKLAPEVTAGLPTFGIRMPRNPHALALLKLANVPLAAPSANASTKPSPTQAEHVKYDLEGRISTIIDGGYCDVGVESTVVDGLSTPPCILRPGGISIEEIRSCPGWEDVTVGYKDVSELNSKPRAPGMKYKHYSPKTRVVLYEHSRVAPSSADIVQYLGEKKSIGLVRTARWPRGLGLADLQEALPLNSSSSTGVQALACDHVSPPNATNTPKLDMLEVSRLPESKFTIHDVSLGHDAEDIARGLFAALRSLDKLDLDAIIVEGVDDTLGDVSAAVMNRLRKAAEIKHLD